MSLTDYLEPRPKKGPAFTPFEVWEIYKDHWITFHPIQGFSVARPGKIPELVAHGLISQEEARAFIDRLPPPLTFGEILRDSVKTRFIPGAPRGS